MSIWKLIELLVTPFQTAITPHSNIQAVLIIAPQRVLTLTIKQQMLRVQKRSGIFLID